MNKNDVVFKTLVTSDRVLTVFCDDFIYRSNVLFIIKETDKSKEWGFLL